MPNIAQALKAEIVRVSRREIKETIKPIQNLRKTVSDLKKRIAVLEAENKRLQSFHKKTQPAQVPAESVEKARVTCKGIRALRSKLGLTRESFGKLLGVSSQAVYSIESKDGPIKLRQKTLMNFLAVRGMGKREVKKMLEG